MKKKIAVVMLALAVFVSGVSINTKAESLKLSESKIEFYPSERHVVVLSSSSNLDKDQIKIKSKNINVKIEGCEQTNINYACLLSFYGFETATEKVEIKYGNQVLYVNTKVKSLGNLKQNMSLHEQYEIAQAKLLAKYRVLSTDDIKSESLRLKVEEELEKLGDRYTEPKNKIEIKEDVTYARNEGPEVEVNGNKKKARPESPEVGNVMLTKNAKTSSFIYGHAGIHGKLGGDVIETRGFGPDGVKAYIDAEKQWRGYPTKTGVWTVKGATKAQRLKATSWAYSKRGKPYGLVEGGDKVFFCTKLVWRSWESQKVKIGHYWFATDMMTKTKNVLKVKELYHK